MQIFIDESGLFLGDEDISAVGALVVPHQNMQGFEKLYGRLRPKLAQERGEVKGRKQTEEQVAAVAAILRKLGCLFEVVVVDARAHSEEDIRIHKAIQEEKITANLTDQHHPNLIAHASRLRSQLERTAPQLYVQACAMAELVYRTIDHADMYYAFRIPRELGEYRWTADAKGASQITPWEDWWATSIMPMTEAKTFKTPFSRIEGGDYRWQEQFRVEVEEYKKTFYGVETGEFYDLKPVLGDIRFSAAPEWGLEAVDILVNGVRRALRGNLSEAGYLPLRELMVHRSRHYINLVSMASSDRVPHTVNYRKVLRAFTEGGRSLAPKGYWLKEASQDA